MEKFFDWLVSIFKKEEKPEPPPTDANERILTHIKEQRVIIANLSNQAYQDAQNNLKDAGTSKVLRNIGKISDMLDKVCLFLDKTPSAIVSARNISLFFNEKTILFATKYHEIITQKEYNQETLQTKERLEEALKKMAVAYQKEYENIKKGEFVDLNADIDVVESEINRLIH